MKSSISSPMGLWVLIFAASIVGRAAPAHAVEVAITSPLEGATVSGITVITGTSLDAAGRVTVSIDGGPFQLATGTNPWSFSWDTTGVDDSPLTILAPVTLTISASPFGDVNGDSLVDLGDTADFVAILLDTVANVGCQRAADVNRDGLFDGNDIQAFVESLTTGG